MPVGNHRRIWLFWDGDCEFCGRVIAWVERRDVMCVIHAVPYQKAPTPPMTTLLAHRCANSVHVITHEGRLLSGGSAGVYVMGRIGFGMTERVGTTPPFNILVETAYRFVARNRRLLNILLGRR